ncbi:MAG: hypothetical protein WCC94_10240 [Candidatus Bathyarchaeia archaeon]
MPKTNYEKARDEMEVLLEEDITVHPVSSTREVWEPMFGLSEGDILERIRSRATGRESGGKEGKEKGVITDCLLTR